jgi:hypothetical protein
MSEFSLRILLGLECRRLFAGPMAHALIPGWNTLPGFQAVTLVLVVARLGAHAVLLATDSSVLSP